MARRAIQGKISNPQANKLRIATIRDEQTSGTGGGTSATSYSTRTLNTLSDPDDIGVTLSSNEFTLPSGEYWITATLYGFGAITMKSKLRRDPSGSPTDEIIGIVAENSSTSILNVVEGRVSVTTSETFDLQTRSDAVNGSGHGLAATFGDAEVYVALNIIRL